MPLEEEIQWIRDYMAEVYDGEDLQDVSSSFHTFRLTLQT